MDQTPERNPPDVGVSETLAAVRKELLLPIIQPQQLLAAKHMIHSRPQPATTLNTDPNAETPQKHAMRITCIKNTNHSLQRA